MTKIVCPKCKVEKELNPEKFSTKLKEFISEHKSHECYLASEKKSPSR